jgi:hypothetical protein
MVRDGTMGVQKKMQILTVFLMARIAVTIQDAPWWTPGGAHGIQIQTD